MPTQKFFNQILIFVNLHQHAKNQFIPSVHSSDIINFIDPSPGRPPPKKNFQSSFALCEFVPACKKSVNPSDHSGDTVKFRVQRAD